MGGDMNQAISAMVKEFGDIKSPSDGQNALKEIIQKIVLLGLHRQKFFDVAAFYGGTALRILYGLNRFSEDLDFCLRPANRDFVLAPYFRGIQDELERFGLEAKITEKKTGPGTEIESAFVKQPTHQGLITIGLNPKSSHPGQLVKIRLEVDKNNPSGGIEERRLIKLPTPFLVNTLTLSSLFAGKLHAVLARAYLNNVKGRDYYDLQFYLARDTVVNMVYLEAKLRDSKHYSNKEPLDREHLLKMLKTKFMSVDFRKAAADVRPFLHVADQSQIDEWSSELFCALIDTLQTSDKEV
jgi:predicted nucleotidyltransferase component of viral defense system